MSETLFEDGCPDEQHSWTEPIVTETSIGTLIAQGCQVCGLNWVRLRRPDGSEIGLAG